MITNQKWNLFEKNWHMSLTMLFGSFIAGATSEGGGAVAFPIMTLFYKISPAVARDFSLLIQAVGMTSASIIILVTRIRILKKVVLLAGIGGFLGIPLGLEISTLLPPPVVKFFFVSLWMAFILVLIFIDRNHTSFRLNHLAIHSNKQKLIFIVLGFIGGIFTGLLGSGIDILIFSYLILKHRVSENIGTPTSVVLMALSSIFGVFWLSSPLTNNIHLEAIDYWLVCIPVVIFGAPLGAIFISKRSQNFIKNFLILSVTIQFFSALFIIKHTFISLSTGFFTLATGIVLFSLMQKQMKSEIVENSID